DRVHDGAGNDPAWTREGDGHAEVHQFPAGIADGEVERACAVEGDHAGEVAYGVQAERVAVDRDLRAGARATDGPADDGGPVQDGQRTEGKELWDRIGSSARDERERERAERGYAGAPAFEQELGADVIGKIVPLRADVLRFDSSESASVLTLLRSDPRVRYAEVDGIVRASRVPNDEFLPTQWSVTKTHAEQAWDLSTGSSQVVVGILDTGTDPGQPDLGGKLVAGYDYVNNDQDPSDDNGHGTAVAGIVAANSDNGIGVAGYCWACRLMPVKVLDADGTGFASGLAQGIVWATDHGARVLNLSLGTPVDDLTLTAAAQYAWLHGALVVAAAGNESSPRADYPAALPNLLSVAASDQSDHLYAFSH